MKHATFPPDMQSLTLNHFLHHTSGLTNRKHMQGIPEGSTPDMLQKTVETLSNTELAFPPGGQYEYGTINYDAPDYAGNKPAGYIISSTEDMARWMNIQMDTVQEIPEVFKAIIPKSHNGDIYVPDINEMYYGAGCTNLEQDIISLRVLLHQKDKL